MWQDNNIKLYYYPITVPFDENIIVACQESQPEAGYNTTIVLVTNGIPKSYV